MTDVTGAPIPGVVSANGFPAFPSWAAGCSATTATMLQPNMWPITAALRAGNVSPGAAFLATVDQSAWCAPSADGLPCYASSVLGLAGSIPASVPASSALDVYGSVQSGLLSYQKAIAAVTADQGVLAVRDLTLAAAQSQVATARNQLGVASRALQGFAINEYVSTGLYSSAPLENTGGPQPLTPSTPKDSAGVVAQQYLGVAANNLLTRDDAAADGLKGSLQRQKAAATAAAQASVTLTTDQVAENQALGQLVKDVATLEHAGACSTVTIAAPAPSRARGRVGQHDHVDLDDDHGGTADDHDDGAAEHHDDDRPPDDDNNNDCVRHRGHDDGAAEHDNDDRPPDHDDDYVDDDGLRDAGGPIDHDRAACGTRRRRGTAGLYRIVRSTQRHLTATKDARSAGPD